VAVRCLSVPAALAICWHGMRITDSVRNSLITRPASIKILYHWSRLPSKFAYHIPFLLRRSRAHATASRSSWAQWATGRAIYAGGSIRWSTWCAAMSWVATRYTATIRLLVLEPGNGRTNDGRPCGSTDAPALWFAYTLDRRGERPQRHLVDLIGVLQADGVRRLLRSILERSDPGNRRYRSRVPQYPRSAHSTTVVNHR
jgi:hypothetical protein